MSEVRFIICDAQREIFANWHGSFADRAIAALSDEPETIEELAAALERFMVPGKAGVFHLFRRFQAGRDDAPYDAGIVIIDLAARLVVCESTYSRPGPEGEVAFHNGEEATDLDVGYHLSDDWEFRDELEGWRERAAARRRYLQENPTLDVRGVIYGPAFLEFIAEECFAHFRGRAEDSDGYGKVIKEIHTRWLMTPRADLRGRTPRETTVEKRRFVSWGIEDRQRFWSLSEHRPRGLARESNAHRFGGFGTHELVVYYDLVRYLLWSCRDAARALPPGSPGDESALRRFVATEVPRLAAQRDQWLAEPNAELDGHIPGKIIENERLRIPEAGSGHEAVVDHDCPLCRAMAEMPGPMFWGLDGSHMDNEFAFSIFHETLEEWEAEQRDHEEFNRRFAAEQEEKKRLGIEHPDGGYTDPDYAWERSFFRSPKSDETMGVRLFAVGAHLAELIVRLKEPPESEDRKLIDRLNRDYGNLREVTRSNEGPIGPTLLQPVIERFCTTLEETAAARQDLAERCTGLAEWLRRFGDPADQVDDPPPDGEEEFPF